MVSPCVDKSQQYTIIYFAHCGYNLTKREGGHKLGTGKRTLHTRNGPTDLRTEKTASTHAGRAGRNVRYDNTSRFLCGKRAMRPDSLRKLAAALCVSADYLLTGDIVDKDLLILADKLRQLTPSQIHTIESIIDECIQLYSEQ